MSTISLNLSSLVKPEEIAEFDFEGLDGFTVKLCYLGRDKLNKLRKDCVVRKISRGEVDETLDLVKFNTMYSKDVVRGWSGLKLSYVSQLMLVGIPEGSDMDSELEYTPENAEALLKHSTHFDKFVSDTLADLSNFTKHG